MAWHPLGRRSTLAALHAPCGRLENGVAAARSVTLVDVCDALTSKRVYRQPMLHNFAVGLIVAGRGTHFDPAVVDAFLQVARDFESMSARNLALDARSAAL